MRKIFTLLLIVAGFVAATAQPYNNDWIKHSQTYYKIKVARDGLYRIPKSLLDGLGIGGTQVQNFELWRNGEKVPFYTPVSGGVLPGNGLPGVLGRTEAMANPIEVQLYAEDPRYQHTRVYA